MPSLRLHRLYVALRTRLNAERVDVAQAWRQVKTQGLMFRATIWVRVGDRSACV